MSTSERIWVMVDCSDLQFGLSDLAEEGGDDRVPPIKAMTEFGWMLYADTWEYMVSNSNWES